MALESFFFSFHLYVYPPDSQESDGSANTKGKNYFDLLPDMPRYCCPVKSFYFGIFSFIKIGLKFKAACQDRLAGESAVKCFPKGTTEWSE